MKYLTKQQIAYLRIQHNAEVKLYRRKKRRQEHSRNEFQKRASRRNKENQEYEIDRPDHQRRLVRNTDPESSRTSFIHRSER